MTTSTEKYFLDWAAAKGLGIDPAYPHSAVLSFDVGGDSSRFWRIPPRPERRPYFFVALLDAMGDWQSCRAWRHMGGWPDPNLIEPARINDVIEARILNGLGIPLASADVLEFDRGELDSLVTLLLSTSIFGWSVGEDLYVVPDRARTLLKVSHHEVVHVDFCDVGEVDPFVAAMADCGFDLPTTVPDATFKMPSWMGGGGG